MNLKRQPICPTHQTDDCCECCGKTRVCIQAWLTQGYNWPWIERQLAQWAKEDARKARGHNPRPGDSVDDG